MGWRCGEDAGNRGSCRVMEKVGFCFRQRQIIKGIDTVFYTLPTSRSPVFA